MGEFMLTKGFLLLVCWWVYLMKAGCFCQVWEFEDNRIATNSSRLPALFLLMATGCKWLDNLNIGELYTQDHILKSVSVTVTQLFITLNYLRYFWKDNSFGS